MQLCFVSVHGPRETYFVDEPSITERMRQVYMHCIAMAVNIVRQYYDVRVGMTATSEVISHAETVGIKVPIFLIKFTFKLIAKIKRNNVSLFVVCIGVQSLNNTK
jgi:hypothetical protein